jgi:hypothetical protein
MDTRAARVVWKPMARVFCHLATGVAVAVAAALLAPTPAAAGKRYYLTVDQFDGGDADTACDKGFHIASLWEILDFAQLKYDTKRGFTSPSGSRPPAGETGWVETGGPANVNGTAGLANCNGYASTMVLEFGTSVELSAGWSGDATPISPWEASNPSCSVPLRVWCKQN